MNFRDQGIIITKKPLKENTAIITLLTKSHGLYSGVIRENNKKMGDNLVEGNLVDFFWQARLHEHLGSAKCELIRSYNSRIILDKTRLYAFNSIVGLIKKAFHEREPHNNFFPIFQLYLDKISASFSFSDYIKLEIAILAESGHKLLLDSCAVTGSRQSLAYVSPKSGRAVCNDVGRPYASKLLKLPAFLAGNDNNLIDDEQKKQAFILTSYFFDRYILLGKDVPERSKFREHMLGYL